MAEQRPIRVGMEVFGIDGAFIGRVKEVGPDDMLIDRTLKPDIRVPWRAVREVIDGHVSLTVRADQAADLTRP